MTSGTSTTVLGINAYHGDASACILRDGLIIAAAEEERFRRKKHWAGLPSLAVRYCLDAAGVTLGQIDYLAVNQDAAANLWQKTSYVINRRPDLALVLDRLRNKRERRDIAAALASELNQPFQGEVKYVEHHMAHLASAYLVSPFDRAVVVSVDGFGDFASAAWGTAESNCVSLEDKVFFPHSLGIFYQALTQFLGFPHYGDEYKVMGLAPYGEPRHMDAMRQLVMLRDSGKFELDLTYFRHARERIDYEWDGGEPSVGTLYTGALEALLGPARTPGSEITDRHRDIARSVQLMYEEAFFHLLNALYRRHGIDALALAGGCAMNSVANGKVYRNTPFRRLYVQAAAGDAGGAIGAAVHVMGQVSGSSKRVAMDHAYWGPSFSDSEIESLIASKHGELNAAGCIVCREEDEAALCESTAQAIAEGHVIGWFQGRMEWGPRALGNRSILCDPRRSDMKEILNRKIKRRESFRPFAPSVLREATAEWFETDDDVPFMMQVYQIRQEKRGAIPAVTHVDGSGRLQTVTTESNPRYYRLIDTFRRHTGVPMVLNTSFNENEPVVCKPEEALDCFLRTNMDMLVMGNWIVSRSSAPLK